MKFLVDAQLPRRMAEWLRQNGYDAVHTLDLPDGNRTSDQNIERIALSENRIVVTKDADFVRSFLATGNPSLWLMSTGNITNAELLRLIQENWSAIEKALTEHRFIELSRSSLIVHA